MSGKASEACEEVLGDRARPAMLLMQGEGGDVVVRLLEVL